MAKKKFDLNKRSKPMSEVIQEFEGEKETFDAVAIFENSPNKLNHEKVVEAIKNDKSLLLDKNELLSSIQDSFVQAFSYTALPSSYLNLKEEAQYLAQLNQVSGLYMAQRLIKIRDEELYKTDGYTSFKSFIESEIPLGKTSVYNYMDIYELFLESDNSDSKIEMIGKNRSKIIPFLPLLKSDKVNDDKKKEIKKDVLALSDHESFRMLNSKARILKDQYLKGKSQIEEPREKNSVYYAILESIPELNESDNIKSALEILLKSLYTTSNLTTIEFTKLKKQFGL